MRLRIHASRLPPAARLRHDALPDRRSVQRTRDENLVLLYPIVALNRTPECLIVMPDCVSSTLT